MGFEPGQSGNPSGRSKKSNKAAGMAREYTEAAIAVHIKNLKSDDADTAHKAAEAILARGWGKPQEYVEHSNDPDAPLNLLVSYIDRNSNPEGV